MPGMDGIETARRLKALPLARHTPIVFLTGAGERVPQAASIYRTGAVDFLAKPFDPEVLCSKVSVFVELHRRGERLREEAAARAHEQAAREQAEGREREVRLLADSIPAIVWRTGPRGQLTFLNRRWAELTGQPPDAREASILAALHADDKGRFLDGWSEALAQGSTFELECRVRAADGSFRWHLLRSVPLRDNAHAITSWFGTGLDIEAQKRAEAERERALEAEHEAKRLAEDASRLKDEFLATVSHELRTPLTAIVGWAHLLLGEMANDPEALRKGLEVIARNARAQKLIVEDLLDISRIIQHRLRLDLSQVDLSAVVAESIDTVRGAALAKGITLAVRGAEPAYRLAGDAGRLRQVACNLLSNAIKFTPEGGSIDVEISRSPEHLALSVIDTGTGISPAFLPHIFEPFRQADTSICRVHGGLGLGLSIVRRIAELHGGSVAVESEPGRGSTFTVMLPVNGPPSASPTPIADGLDRPAAEA
jgi:PAS domain S-box-containing protein